MKAFLSLLFAVTAMAVVLASGSSACAEGVVMPPTITGCVPSADNAEFVINEALDKFECNGRKYRLKNKVCQDICDGGSNLIGTLEINAFEFDPDPTVFHSYTITNTTGTTQTYSLLSNLPTAFAAPNIMSGSVTVQVIDSGQDGATLAAVSGGAIYSAMIDGATVYTMLDDPFTLTAPSAGVDNALDSFSNEPGMAITTSMGIGLNFTLSAGDTASFLSRFDVVAVPEPSSIALVLSALVGGLLLLRRR